MYACCWRLLGFPFLQLPNLPEPDAGGARKPAEFLCLVLKLLQIQPDKEIIIEYIKNEDYKYVRVLGARRSHMVLLRCLGPTNFCHT